MEHSVVMVSWKETAFSLWRAMDRSCNKNVVFLVSSVMVMVVISLPICSVIDGNYKSYTRHRHKQKRKS